MRLLSPRQTVRVLRIKKSVMNHIRAIGFDLFNTLITVEPHTLDEAIDRLIHSLRRSGLIIEYIPFKKAHRQAAVKFIEETRSDGRETHNSFWISAALETQGYNIPPDDPRIAAAINAYFSAFLELCRLIPGTGEMLDMLGGKYRLGLLSNFTHAPAAFDIIDRLDLASAFHVVLISAELGYRKPAPLVFKQLLDRLGVKKDELIYIGDDPECDILGARQAGIQPIWTTYVEDKEIPFAPGPVSERAQRPDITVPRISTWNDLYSLLDKG